MLWVSLIEKGMLIACTPASAARAAPLALGTSATTFSPSIPREGDQLGGVGHLRQQARRNEAPHFDLADPGGRLGCDPAFFRFERHDPADRLQPIARADFGNEDFGHLDFSR
jgi:hypothetical protein